MFSMSEVLCLSYAFHVLPWTAGVQIHITPKLPCLSVRRLLLLRISFVLLWALLTKLICCLSFLRSCFLLLYSLSHFVAFLFQSVVDLFASIKIICVFIPYLNCLSSSPFCLTGFHSCLPTYLSFYLSPWRLTWLGGFKGTLLVILSGLRCEERWQPGDSLVTAPENIAF